jgi:hypothetical protein
VEIGLSRASTLRAPGSYLRTEPAYEPSGSLSTAATRRAGLEVDGRGQGRKKTRPSSHRRSPSRWVRPVLMFRMTESMTVIQARVPIAIARQADEDAALLGLANRSAAVRLRLLHRRARENALAQDCDDFYRGTTAPLSDVTATGEQVAATAMADRGHCGPSRRGLVDPRGGGARAYTTRRTRRADQHARAAATGETVAQALAAARSAAMTPTDGLWRRVMRSTTPPLPPTRRQWAARSRVDDYERARPHLSPLPEQDQPYPRVGRPD